MRAASGAPAEHEEHANEKSLRCHKEWPANNLGFMKLVRVTYKVVCGPKFPVVQCQQKQTPCLLGMIWKKNRVFLLEFGESLRNKV